MPPTVIFNLLRAQRCSPISGAAAFHSHPSLVHTSGSAYRNILQGTSPWYIPETYPRNISGSTPTMYTRDAEGVYSSLAAPPPTGGPSRTKLKQHIKTPNPNKSTTSLSVPPSQRNSFPPTSVLLLATAFLCATDNCQTVNPYSSLNLSFNVFFANTSSDLYISHNVKYMLDTSVRIPLA